MLRIYSMAMRIFLTMAVLVTMAELLYAKDTNCYQEVAVTNSSGKTGFGAIWDYPGDIQPSVWFPIVPRAVAIDSKGDIYVGDSVNYRVLKFNSNGDFLLEIKLQPPVKVIKPEISHIIRDIGIDKDNNVYVWNYLEARVEIYDSSGKFKESVRPNDEKQKGVFTKTSKGKFSKYIYEIDSYIPDKQRPGKILYSITVLDVSSKEKKVVSKCGGVELASDEDGLIYSFDYNGNIYTFDPYLNVIKINPFK